MKTENTALYKKIQAAFLNDGKTFSKEQIQPLFEKLKKALASFKYDGKVQEAIDNSSMVGHSSGEGAVDADIKYLSEINASFSKYSDDIVVGKKYNEFLKEVEKLQNQNH